jgi:hypothetical protein
VYEILFRGFVLSIPVYTFWGLLTKDKPCDKIIINLNFDGDFCRGFLRPKVTVRRDDISGNSGSFCVRMKSVQKGIVFIYG